MRANLSDGTRGLTERQRRVLHAAMEVFAQRGYAGASTAEIAQRAGVAEGTIFKRFKTKKHLLLDMLGPYLIELGSPGALEVIARFMARPDAGVADLVRLMAEDRLAFATRHPMVLRIVLQELPLHPELRASVLEQVTGRILPVLDGAVAELQARGRVDPALPRMSVARIVAAEIAGYVVARLAVPEAPWDDRAEIDLLGRVLERGLAPP